MRAEERERFDALLAEAIDELPDHLHALIDEVPIIVEDEPSAKLIKELAQEHGEPYGPEFAAELCGLHTGVPLTERSVHDTEMPTDIRLFRRGVVNVAGGWDQPDADDVVYEEIMITLLHEIGHHFGLDEADLEELGYD